MDPRNGTKIPNPFRLAAMGPRLDRVPTLHDPITDILVAQATNRVSRIQDQDYGHRSPEFFVQQALGGTSEGMLSDW